MTTHLCFLLDSHNSKQAVGKSPRVSQPNACISKKALRWCFPNSLLPIRGVTSGSTEQLLQCLTQDDGAGVASLSPWRSLFSQTLKEHLLCCIFLLVTQLLKLLIVITSVSFYFAFSVNQDLKVV